MGDLRQKKLAGMPQEARSQTEKEVDQGEFEKLEPLLELGSRGP